MAILSNISPSLPNDIMFKEFKLLRVKPVFFVTFIGAGVVDLAYMHILSFHRQVFCAIEDFDKISSSILLKFGDNHYNFLNNR